DHGARGDRQEPTAALDDRAPRTPALRRGPRALAPPAQGGGRCTYRRRGVPLRTGRRGVAALRERSRGAPVDGGRADRLRLGGGACGGAGGDVPAESETTPHAPRATASTLIAAHEQSRPQ